MSLGLDPWLISNAIHKEFAKTINEKLFDGKMVTLSETERRDATCLGQPGSAAVTSAVQVGADTGTMWTCTLLHDGDAIMIGYYFNQNVAAGRACPPTSLEQTELLAK